MARGPLPNPARRRTNQPTIPSTRLPAEGRQGPTPRCPLKLGKVGRAWWRWAWALPQACAWSSGDLYALARRATLEDDLAALGQAVNLDVAALLDIEEEDHRAAELEWLVRYLLRLATNKLSILREMRELDKAFGLTPKGLADLRWSIDPQAEPEEPSATPPAPPVRRLRAVDLGEATPA